MDSDLDLMMVDISNEKDWDTDLEVEGQSFFILFNNFAFFFLNHIQIHIA